MNEEGLTAYGLRTMGMNCPLGIDTEAPELSWKLASDVEGQRQTAYEIEAAGSEDFTDVIWTSGALRSEKPFGAVYGGGYKAGQRVYWRVRVRNEKMSGADFLSPHGSNTE